MHVCLITMAFWSGGSATYIEHTTNVYNPKVDEIDRQIVIRFSFFFFYLLR